MSDAGTTTSCSAGKLPPQVVDQEDVRRVADPDVDALVVASERDDPLVLEVVRTEQAEHARVHIRNGDALERQLEVFRQRLLRLQLVDDLRVHQDLHQVQVKRLALAGRGLLELRLGDLLSLEQDALGPARQPAATPAARGR